MNQRWLLSNHNKFHYTPITTISSISKVHLQLHKQEQSKNPYANRLLVQRFPLIERTNPGRLDRPSNAYIPFIVNANLHHARNFSAEWICSYFETNRFYPYQERRVASGTRNNWNVWITSVTRRAWIRINEPSSSSFYPEPSTGMENRRRKQFLCLAWSFYAGWMMVSVIRKDTAVRSYRC